MFYGKKGIMDAQSAIQNQRKAVRKPLHSRGNLTLNGQVLRFETVDVGVGGICIVLPQQLTIGQLCRIDVSVFIRGKKLDIAANSKACYCVCGRDGFRVGLQFTDITEAGASAINLYMKEK